MKTKVAYIVSLTDGLETFVKREIEAMMKLGLDIDIFATKSVFSEGFNPPENVSLYQRSFLHLLLGIFKILYSKPVRFIELLIHSLRFGTLVEFFLALSWHHQMKYVTAIHASFGDRKFFIAHYLGKIVEVSVTVAIHAHEIYAQPNPKMFIEACKDVAKIVTISNKNKELLIKKYQLKSELIEVIKLPIDTDYWQRRDDIKILTVARYTPRKGWDDLIKAAKILGDGFHFITVGFGNLDIAKMAQDEGVADKFTVFSKLKPQQIRILMESSDIFCLPSKANEEEGSEGIPVVLMEAMAMGMTIISTDDGSICELVDRHIVKAGDFNALATVISETAKNLADNKPNKYSSEGEYNRSKVMQMHNPENFTTLKQFFEEASQLRR